jgi:2-polyprenyl-3-methyl-5-hydroxy-6-metoxy-1,4-benzoquinol methylase
MRRDWNERALQDAERFVYTRNSDADEADFSSSGRANYDQLVRPYLPVLLNGADPRDCRVLEIGCGVGRMTRWFAASFGEVHGIDIATEMIGQARDHYLDIDERSQVNWPEDAEQERSQNRLDAQRKPTGRIHRPHCSN